MKYALLVERACFVYLCIIWDLDESREVQSVKTDAGVWLKGFIGDFHVFTVEQTLRGEELGEKGVRYCIIMLLNPFDVRELN